MKESGVRGFLVLARFAQRYPELGDSILDFLQSSEKAHERDMKEAALGILLISHACPELEIKAEEYFNSYPREVTNNLKYNDFITRYSPKAELRFT